MKSLRQATWDMADIYQEDRYAKPKYAFECVLKVIEAWADGREQISLVDAGTANAAFPYYVKQMHPGFAVTGVELDEGLVAQAKAQVPDCDFITGDVCNMETLSDKQFDVVCCLGVLSIFDDYRPAMNELLRVVKPGGLIVINNMWNALPVDINIKARRATTGPQTDFSGWMAGWNMISMQTMSEFLVHQGCVESFEFTKLVLPFDIERNDGDLMRSWTTQDKQGERIHTNGLGRILDKRLLTIKIKES